MTNETMTKCSRLEFPIDMTPEECIDTLEWLGMMIPKEMFNDFINRMRNKETL